MSQASRAVRMSLAAADAAIQAAQAAVRAAHAMVMEQEPAEQAPRQGCPGCGSEDLREVPSMSGTVRVCGDCGKELEA